MIRTYVSLIDCLKTSRLPLEERIGLSMKHSGVAITITSVTDILAFGIGSMSSLPAFGSFCSYASIGIFAVFISMALFFLAWLVLDQERIDARRYAIFCCFRKNDSWRPKECSKKSFLEKVFRIYADVLDKISFKMSILLLTGALFGASCCGVCHLKTNFNIADWFPSGSRLADVTRAESKYFPQDKIRGKLYIYKIPNIGENLQQLQDIFKHVEEIPDAKVDINSESFIPSFIKYLNEKYIELHDMNDYKFKKHLKEFLCNTPWKNIWKSNINFVGENRLNCTNELTPQVRMMTFPYQHKW